MEKICAEADYPIGYRLADARELGKHILRRRSVTLVGMKRVGISNFLRFFLNHPQINSTYIDKRTKYIFIPVDLNDLVERELFPFWTLTMKRIADTAEGNDLIPRDLKTRINTLFLESIQSQDVFLMIDAVRQALILFVENDFLPTVFLLRFDRIKDAINPAFFDNLQGLFDATSQKLSFVFTSFRSLDELMPSVASIAGFAPAFYTQYLKPASMQDMNIVHEAYEKMHGLSLSQKQKNDLFELVGGNIQYLQLGLVIIGEIIENKNDLSKFISTISEDERIILQSEELWEGLSITEKNIIRKVLEDKAVSREEIASVPYLWNTGYLVMSKNQHVIFSSLFSDYVLQVAIDNDDGRTQSHFTRKENLLYNLLKSHIGEICEREVLVEKVWPEYSEFGVSDWAVDRLVARVRAKLKLQGSKSEIKTIRTRGYQLIEKH